MTSFQKNLSFSKGSVVQPLLGSLRVFFRDIAYWVVFYDEEGVGSICAR